MYRKLIDKVRHRVSRSLIDNLFLIIALLVMIGVAKSDIVNEFPTNGSGGSGSRQCLQVTSQMGNDICQKFNNAIMTSYVSIPPMAPICWAPGDYTAAVQCEIPQTSSDLQSDTSANLDIYAYGVNLHTTGAINGINIYAGGGGGNKTTLRGLNIVHDNPDQLNGYDIGQASDFTCEDCKYDNRYTGTPNSSSIAMRIGNRTIGDDNTFTQSAKIIRPKIMCLDREARQGGGTRILKGISIQRAANVLIADGTIFSCQTQILLTDDPSAGTGIGPEAVVIAGMDIEASTSTAALPVSTTGSAIAMNFTTDAPASQIADWNFLNNNFDNDNVVFEMVNAPSQPFIHGPYMVGNHIVPNNRQYVHNPQGKIYSSYDNYYFSAQSVGFGLYLGSLALGSDPTQGIQGSATVNKLANPAFAVVPVCTVAGGETCSTQRCYRIAAVDYSGFIGGATSEVCTAVGPDTLSSTNKVLVNPAATIPIVGVAGWRVYGRGTGAELYMNPGGKTVNSVTVSLLNIDSTAFPTVSSTRIFPTFTDDGSLTPSGAVPTINSTGIFASPIVRRVPTTFGLLPACAAGTQGYQAMITDDSNACTFGTAAAGTGGTVCSVGCDGTSYKAGY